MGKGLFITLLILAWLNLHESLYAVTKETHPPQPSNVLYVENKNQWESFIRYEADFKGGKLFLENNRFTYVFYHPDDIQSLHPHEGKQLDKIRLHSIRIHAIGGNEKPTLVADHPANYHHNYFLGNNPSRWAADVQLFSSVTYQDIYANIDLKFYSSHSDIKYDIAIKPGADASQMAFEYEGVDDLLIKNENLLIKLSIGTIVEQKPYAYQVINGIAKEVSCKFVLRNQRISFRFPNGYNKSFPLIIDPTLNFSSFTGSSADNWGFTATYDSSGNLYSGGNVNSAGYPTTIGAYDLSYNGGSNFDGNGWACDMAIAKFNATGTSLLYTTYLGGSSNEQPQSLIVDGNNDLVIFGTTYSTNYPTTAGAFHSTSSGNCDIVISKLSTNGNLLLASTYVGGSADDGLNTDPGFSITGPLKYNYSDEARGEIIFDANNDYIVGSCSKSADFPTTPGVLQPAFGGGNQDGIIFKINSSLTNLLWSTFLGGSSDDAAYDLTIDNSGDYFIAGGTNSTDFPTTPGVLHTSYQGGSADGFITHISGGGNSIIASTYMGTSSYDQTYFVELDNSGDVYTTGQTEGAYPVTPGVYSNANSKQFIHKMDPGLGITFYSTVFGNGSSVPNISPTAFLVDTCENVYVAGWGRCLSFGSFTHGDVTGMPTTPNAIQTSTDGCDFYFFVLNHDASSLAYATFFGGSLSSEHVDGGTSRFNKNGTIYESVCAGCGGRSDFPTTPGVVSRTNNSSNCNNGVIKLSFNLTTTVSAITGSHSSGCAPLPVTFVNNSINANSFVWDFDDGSPPDYSTAPMHTFSDTGSYQVMLVAINTSSCNSRDTAYFNVDVTGGSPVHAAFNLSRTLPCDPTVITQFTGAGGNSWLWDFGDGYQSAGFNSSHTYSHAGIFQLMMIAEDTVCNLLDTAIQVINIHQPVHAQINSANILSGCVPQEINLSNSFSSGGNYTWYLGDGNISTNQVVQHVYQDTGTYQIQLIISDTVACNLRDTDVFVLHVFSNPIAGFLYDQKEFYFINEDIHFYNRSKNAVYYTWNFDDGISSVDPDVTHQFREGGMHEVCLQTISQNGCMDSACASLDLLESEMIYVPTVFTPNGDGVNDVFRIYSTGLIQADVIIYNRWGEKIYEYNSPDGSWDGNYKGEPVTDDFYIWKLQARGIANKDIEKTGSVMIMK